MQCSGIILRLVASLTTIYTCWFCLFATRSAYLVSIDNVTGVTGAPTQIRDILPLLQNSCLLILFVLQHSLLKSHKDELGLNPSHHRLLYIFTSTGILHIVHDYWRVCWVITELPLTTTTIQTLHMVAWAWLACSILLADFWELFGFSHIKHEEAGLQEPVYYKSRGARRVLQHYRHPAALGPLILLLSCKTVTADRLLLVGAFLLYTLFKSHLDYRDYLYLRYVSYPLRKYTFQKVEMRSRATVVRETHASFCFSDEEQAPSDQVHSDTDLGYSSSPTNQKPQFIRILATSTPNKTKALVEERTCQKIVKCSQVRRSSRKSNIKNVGQQKLQQKTQHFK